MENVIETFSSEQRKQGGMHYTPLLLATFVAESIFKYLAVGSHSRATLRVLDPAAGDGELLLSFINSAVAHSLPAPEIHGFDTSQEALDAAKKRLTNVCSENRISLRSEDFLRFALGYQDTLFRTEEEPFDLVISNPPYVRTQVMGAEEAQKVAGLFDLTGRVDLYHAFIKGIGLVLRPGGIAGIIVSNRFMTTKAGSGIRDAINEIFDILHVWDLGDTKIFEAAVLPAVLLLRKKTGTKEGNPLFTSIYTAPGESTFEHHAANPIAALTLSGKTLIGSQVFLVQQGRLENNGVWRLSNEKTDTWLDQVKKKTFCTFGDVGKIAVGVKTTADKVFIRKDWSSFGIEKPELLKPLITHHIGRRYRATQPKGEQRQILYPHEILNGKRTAVDLEKYPKTKTYLTQHREALESRKYVIDAGRNWFEIWVPQDPGAWERPKIIFRDISEKPEFWIDLDGGVVNGDCYWISADKPEKENWLWLILAVSNSKFIESFYDKSFNNKLYAGRRRFMTQYVKSFPLPDPKTDTALELIATAKRLYQEIPSIQAEELATSMERLVQMAFGLS